MSDITFGHTGDLGDIIASLPSVRAHGNANYVIGWKADGQRESMRGERFDTIKPLLQIQPYIQSVEWLEHFDIGVTDFTKFRTKYQPSKSLLVQQAEAVGLEKVDDSPWLTIPQVVVHNRPIIARTNRYRNSMFPWRKLLDKFKNGLFIGNKIEHFDFENQYGKIEKANTPTLLDMACLIQSSPILICNQSCPFWIGAGLGVPIIQETYHPDMNSIVPRRNILYTRNAAEINKLLDTL